MPARRSIAGGRGGRPLRARQRLRRQHGGRRAHVRATRSPTIGLTLTSTGWRHRSSRRIALPAPLFLGSAIRCTSLSTRVRRGSSRSPRRTASRGATSRSSERCRRNRRVVRKGAADQRHGRPRRHLLRDAVSLEDRTWVRRHGARYRPGGAILEESERPLAIEVWQRVEDEATRHVRPAEGGPIAGVRRGRGACPERPGSWPDCAWSRWRPSSRPRSADDSGRARGRRHSPRSDRRGRDFHRWPVTVGKQPSTGPD